MKYVEAMVNTVRSKPPLLVPVGDIQSVAVQLDRKGFLPGDEVAVIKLSDLHALLRETGRMT